MATSFEDELARPKDGRRPSLAIRAAVLIAEQTGRHELRGIDGVPGRTRGRQG